MADYKAAAEALVPKFQYAKTLNQDQAGRRISLLGSIDDQPALLVLERAPFPTSSDYLGSVARDLRSVRNLGANDIYHWFMAAEGAPDSNKSSEAERDAGDNLKINLIYPCTQQHIRKYSRQGIRFVTETAEIYRERVRPFVQAQRDAGRLNWVFNIIEGRKEVEDVIYRTPYDPQTTNDKGYLLAPDLNWDRTTLEALHLLAIVERRDIWSLRDLRRSHIPWLRQMRQQLIDSTIGVYGSQGLEADQLKLYVHYQPTYYHFHIHIVHVQLESGATQATGKAVGLESLIEQLEHMSGGDDAGMDAVSLSYTLGEASELWAAVFGPLKEEEAKKRAVEAST